MLSLYIFFHLSSSVLNPVQPNMSAQIRKKSSSVADYLLFRQQNRGISSLPATVPLTSLFPAVPEIWVATSSSTGATVTSSSSQSLNETMRATNPPRVRDNGLPLPGSPVEREERMRATNPPRVRPNALPSPGSPIAGEVSEDKDAHRERVLAEFAAYNARCSAAKETSKQKIKDTHAAADHIRHEAGKFQRRGAALLTPGSPIADEVTGGGEGLGSRIMSPSGGFMLASGRRSGVNPSQEIESDDRVEASRELHVSQRHMLS